LLGGLSKKRVVGLTISGIISICLLCWLALQLYHAHLHQLGDREIREEMALVRDYLQYDANWPTPEQMDSWQKDFNSWLDSHERRECYRTYAQQHQDEACMDAWLILLAARDSKALREISDYIRVLDRTGDESWKTFKIFKYISVLRQSRNPEAKNILWWLILRPSQRSDVRRCATKSIAYLGSIEDIPKLLSSFESYIHDDPGYVTIVRNVVEMLLGRAFPGATEEEKNKVFNAWTRQQRAHIATTQVQND